MEMPLPIEEQPQQSQVKQEVIHPFPGLRPFTFNDKHLFFGRDGQSEKVLELLLKKGLLLSSVPQEAGNHRLSIVASFPNCMAAIFMKPDRCGRSYGSIPVTGLSKTSPKRLLSPLPPSREILKNLIPRLIFIMF